MKSYFSHNYSLHYEIIHKQLNLNDYVELISNISEYEEIIVSLIIMCFYRKINESYLHGNYAVNVNHKNNQ